MAPREANKVAFVSDADDHDEPIPSTERFATTSVAAPSPSKEKPNTGRTRTGRTGRTDSSSSSPHNLTDSDSATVQGDGARRRSSSKLKIRSGDRAGASSAATAATAAAPTGSVRPSAKHSKTSPTLSSRADEASYYGVPSTMTPAVSRPRAQTTRQRPQSYYGPGTRPPQSHTRFWAQPPPPQPVQPAPPTSFPPPSWAVSPHAVASHPYAQPAPPEYDYFPPQPQPQRLAERLNGRPQSAMGQRPSRHPSYEYEQEVDERELRRRSSQSKKKAERERERELMPPPPRPIPTRPFSARPAAGLGFRPPPVVPPPRPEYVYADDALHGDPNLYRDVSPRAPPEVSPFTPHPQRLSYTNQAPPPGAVPYTEVAHRIRSRPNSYYGGDLSSSYEEKLANAIRNASLYQDEVNGQQPAAQLTADTLRKVSQPSSRSTRSSRSRDESDYRQSATTRTSMGEDEVTIRVKGSTTLKVGDAEIEIATGGGGGRSGTTVRGGSENASHYDFDDRRSRGVPTERPSTRRRASSQAASQGRKILQAFAVPVQHDYPHYDQYGVPYVATQYAPYPYAGAYR